MAAQKHTKNCWQNLFAFLNACKPKSQLIKGLNSFDFSRSFGRLSQNPKTRDFRVLFLQENDLKTCSTVNFPKNIHILEAWKPTKDMKFTCELFSCALLHMNLI